MAYHLGIIGAGNMAEAIARGLLRSDVLPANQMIAADVSPDRRALFENELGVKAVDTNAQLALVRPRCLLLSVKPQQMADVLAKLAADLAPETLVISIAAGISSNFIEKHLGAAARWRVIRVMPNTPMLVGQGMAALCKGTHATSEDGAAARRIFECAAQVIEVPESLMDAVTAVSGSGPAYLFYLVEQMIRAGTDLGLSEPDARLLASQTVAGAAAMLLASDDAPAELRRKVTSPGGTTQAAITHLDDKAVGQSIVEAVKAAAARSKELGS